MPAKGWSGSKYTERMPDQLIELLSAGKERAHFCAEHSISGITFDLWLKLHPEFAAAYEVAKEKAKMWYLNVAQEYIVEIPEGGKLNTTLWSMIMRNRFEMTEHRKLRAKEMAEAATSAGKLAAIMNDLADGKITAGEAVQLSQLVQLSVKIDETVELERRVQQIESSQRSGVADSEFKEE